MGTVLFEIFECKLSERIDNAKQFSTEWTSAVATIHSFWELHCIVNSLSQKQNIVVWFDKPDDLVGLEIAFLLLVRPVSWTPRITKQQMSLAAWTHNETHVFGSKEGIAEGNP